MGGFEPPDERIIAAAMEGRRMPAEKVVMWLLRILILLSIAVIMLLHRQAIGRVEALEEWRVSHEEWSRETELKLREMIVAQDKNAAVAIGTAIEVHGRLNRIEAKLDTLTNRVSSGGAK